MLASRMSDEVEPKPVLAPAAPAAATAADAKRAPRARNPWPFVALVAVLCAVGWFLVTWMADTTSIQDCVMSGKKNCGTPVDPKLGR
jgi:hypothetical protein